MKAHSKQQYDKCKGFLNGEYKLNEMYVLAQTYTNEIVSLVGYNRFRLDTDKNIITAFCKAITLN